MNTFYEKGIQSGVRTLSEEEAKHCLLVLRMKKGDEIRLVDGLGAIYRAVLTQVDKKKCAFELLEEFQTPAKPFSVHLVIAPTKNADRMEWMVEKLSEIGVDELSFIATEHSERTKIRIDRLEKKAISAMKQSGGTHLMKIAEAQTLEDSLAQLTSDQAFMAHVSADHAYMPNVCKPGASTTLFIGPEGDFTYQELARAQAVGVVPVSLGRSVLRTETAGLLGCHTIHQVNMW